MYMERRARPGTYPTATESPDRQAPRLPYRLRPGESLFRQGDSRSGLFEVVEGAFRLGRLTRGGKRHVVGFGLPGDILGYAPGACHISDCDALGSARVIRYRPDALQACAGSRLQAKLLDGALRQVGAMQDHCMVLGRNSALERVAAFLVSLGDRFGGHRDGLAGFDLPMSRGDIADYLGLTTETVSRSLTELRKAGLIDISNIHEVVLLDPQGLEALAEQEA